LRLALIREVSLLETWRRWRPSAHRILKVAGCQPSKELEHRVARPLDTALDLCTELILGPSRRRASLTESEPEPETARCRF
jgi:hypothetical protein